MTPCFFRFFSRTRLQNDGLMYYKFSGDSGLLLCRYLKMFFPAKRVKYRRIVGNDLCLCPKGGMSFRLFKEIVCNIRQLCPSGAHRSLFFSINTRNRSMLIAQSRRSYKLRVTPASLIERGGKWRISIRHLTEGVQKITLFLLGTIPRFLNQSVQTGQD